ncbi:MAG: GIY-YIG nuclease family protein [Bacteroidetes bacterium]|nr:GIY-YIG nuclease family protein [Bacteroidota bacterium]
MNYVYVLVSQKDNKRYIGLTNNLQKRLSQHNSGKVKCTKYRRPFSIIYYEKFENRTEAAKREKFFKSGKGREFLNKI